MYAWSKTFSAPITETTATKKCPGLSSGNVIFQKVRQRPAPSIAAAS
jgi:hypothetical protein